MMLTQRLGGASLPEEEVKQDKKNCQRFGPCGVGKKALYLNSLYIERQYYVPIASVSRIFKRIAMSKGGFTKKGVFGTLPYLVVEYDDGKEKQCRFRHEEDVDRLLSYIETHFPNIPLHSAEAERKLAEKARKHAQKKYATELSQKAKMSIHHLEQAEAYLHRNEELYLALSQSAKRKRAYDRSVPAYKWVALAVTLIGICAFGYGIYALVIHVEFGVYFLLFGLAAIFLFSSANILPTSRNNRKYIEKQLEEALHRMEQYIQSWDDFPVPARYSHPIVLRRMQEIIKEGRAEEAEQALEVLKTDLKALNSSVVVEQEEYEEVVEIKPMFLVMDYK